MSHTAEAVAVPVKSGYNGEQTYVATPVNQSQSVYYAQNSQQGYQQQGYQQPGYQPGYQQSPVYVNSYPPTPPQVVITTQTPVYYNAGACPGCGSNSAPVRSSSSISMRQIIFIILLLFVFWPLFFLPLLMPSCYRRTYSCPQCGMTRYTDDDC
mmetsp:Transcript_5201/g.9019  ORF Transcript_5201/g.9019 Transcript_5201/m.9019 type:complete len:154 (+) Transcript_5201:1191-1652(+)